MAEQALNLGFTSTTLTLYRGSFLAKSESPFYAHGEIVLMLV